MNYKLTKEQITNCIEYLRKDNNQTPITSNSIAYNLFFYNIKQVLLDLTSNPSPIKNYDYFINNFGLNRQSLIKVLTKKNIIKVDKNEGVKVIGKNIQHNIKRLYQYLVDYKEHKQLKEETGCGGASGAFETPAFSTPIKKNINEIEKVWKDGKEVQFKPECIKYGNKIHCEEGGGSKSPIKNI